MSWERRPIVTIIYCHIKVEPVFHHAFKLHQRSDNLSREKKPTEKSMQQEYLEYYRYLMSVTKYISGWHLWPGWQSCQGQGDSPPDRVLATALVLVTHNITTDDLRKYYYAVRCGLLPIQSSTLMYFLSPVPLPSSLSLLPILSRLSYI